jgi:hypothetical protein
VRYEEAASGEIHHALRFTLPRTKAAMAPPATHWAATNRGSPIPMGMRLRLKADVDISGYSAINQVVFRAMKKYGLILADNGSEMYVSGAPDSHWSSLGLRQWRDLKASDFEVVAMPRVFDESSTPEGSAPKITSFKAMPSQTTAGQEVTLQWQAQGASYFYLEPGVGFVRGNQIVVHPAETTQFKLTATGESGRTTATVTVSSR